MLTEQDLLSRAGAILGEAWRSDGAVQSQVRLQIARYVRRLGTLEGATGRVLRRRMYQALRSFDARFCSILMSWKGSSSTLNVLHDLASELDARADCGEPVSVYFKQKVGGWRPICSFGPKRRALQRLARDLLEAALGASPFDFLRRGQGRNRVMAEVTNAIEKGGGRWVLSADIKSFYKSVNKEGLYGVIPLPRAVIDHCILIPDTAVLEITALKGSVASTSEIAARSGIPHGSLASPFVAALLLRPVLQKLNGVVVLSHGDDVHVITKTEKEATVNQQAVQEQLTLHPAGPLLMKHNVVAPVGRPIDILGYRLRRRWPQYGGGVRYTPSPQAFANMVPRVFQRLVDSSSLKTVSADASKIAERWASGFPHWDRSALGDDLFEITVMTDVVMPALKVLGTAAKQKAFDLV